MSETATLELPSVGEIKEVPANEVNPSTPVERIEMPTAFERGATEKVIDVAVDDNVYCMQHKYELPYTTVDLEGNTVVSIVEKVDVHFPENSDEMRAKLHIKLFKNKTVQVEPVPAPPPTATEEVDRLNPHERNFVDATMNALDHMRKDTPGDRNLRQVENMLMRYETTDTSSISKLRGLCYTAYDDETDITSTATNYYIRYPYKTSATYTPRAYLYPYIKTSATTSITNTWREWAYNDDATYGHHLKYWYGKEKGHPVVDAVERMKEILRSRLAPAAIIRSSHIRPTTDIREIRARQTLRRLIGEEAYQKFLCRGFATYKGVDRTYQIFPGHQRVVVWQKGKRIEELCIVLSGDFPPTDSLIMRLLFVQESEERFRQTANVSPSYAPGNGRIILPEAPAPKALPEIFAGLKIQQGKSLARLVA